MSQEDARGEQEEGMQLREGKQQALESFAVPSPSAFRLTPREWQVLVLLAEGRSNKEIAWRLRISVHMVKAHVSRVLEKLHVASRTEAAVFYIRAGWEHTAPGGGEEEDGNQITKKDA